MAMNLNLDAQRLLGAYQTLADLTPEQESRLRDLGDKEICANDLQQVLDPGCLAQAAKLVKCDPRGEDPIFNTAIIGRPKVIKEQVRVQQPRRQPMGTGVARDPYYAKLEIDPRAQMVVLSSASKFEPDVDRPRPRLMKLVVRTEAEDGKPTEQDWKNFEQLLDESNMRKFVWDPKGDVPIEKLDVRWIGSKTASIETRDVNEPEFDFGSGIVAISLNDDGAELSRDIKIDPENIQRTQTYASIGNSTNPDFNRPIGGPQDNPANDTTPPETFDRRIAVSISTKDLPRGAWVDTPNLGEKMDVELRVGSRWLMEAGASGNVSLLGTRLNTKVREDDAYFNGSTPVQKGVEVPANYSIQNLLQQKVQKQFGRVRTDTKTEPLTVQQLIYKNLQGFTLNGAAIQGPISNTFKHGETAGMTVSKRPIQDARNDGLAMDIELGPEFLAAPEGRSLKGFTLDVGTQLKNAEGESEWCAATHGGKDGLFQVEPNGCGGAKFTVRFDDFPKARADGAPVEIIVRDPNNFPVARVQIPLDEVQWA